MGDLVEGQIDPEKEHATYNLEIIKKVAKKLRMAQERIEILEREKKEWEKQLHYFSDRFDTITKEFSKLEGKELEERERLDAFVEKAKELIIKCDEYAKESSDFSKFDSISNELAGLL